MNCVHFTATCGWSNRIRNELYQIITRFRNFMTKYLPFLIQKQSCVSPSWNFSKFFAKGHKTQPKCRALQLKLINLETLRGRQPLHKLNSIDLQRATVMAMLDYVFSFFFISEGTRPKVNCWLLAKTICY